VIIAGGQLTPALRDAAGPAPGARKALLPVAGRSLAQRALDACAAATTVREIVVAGLSDPADLTVPPSTRFLPDSGSMLGNIVAGARAILPRNDLDAPFLVVSSDLPLLTGPMLDWLAGEVRDPALDFHYSAVSRETMEARFPRSGRSYYRVREGRFCGGDAHVFSLRLVDRLGTLFDELIARRKSVLRLAILFGPAFMARFFAGRMTHEDLCAGIGRRLGVRGRVVVSPFAEIGMDIDTPHHLRAVLAAPAPPR
jgi:hypothetical protein